MPSAPESLNQTVVQACTVRRGLGPGVDSGRPTYRFPHAALPSSRTRGLRPTRTLKLSTPVFVDSHGRMMLEISGFYESNSLLCNVICSLI